MQLFKRAGSEASAGGKRPTRREKMLLEQLEQLDRSPDKWKILGLQNAAEAEKAERDRLLKEEIAELRRSIGLPAEEP